MPAVSVIIPCFNAAATVGLQLQGLVRQECAPDFEVIVVNNRSTDDLEAAVSPFREQLDLRVIDAPDLANPGYARNCGAAAATADAYVFCDADDVVTEAFVSEALGCLSVNPIVNGSAIDTPAASFGAGIDVLVADLPRGRGCSKPDRPVDYPILLGGCCAFRAEVFRALGGYDVGLPYGIEDNDLALRAQRAGHVIAYAEGMGLAYRARPAESLTLRRSFQTGWRHALLAHRHRLFGRSPSLQSRWWLDLPRCLAAAVVMLGRRDGDWHGLAHRAAMAVGLASGVVYYAPAACRPQPGTGVGLSCLADDRWDAGKGQE